MGIFENISPWPPKKGPRVFSCALPRHLDVIGFEKEIDTTGKSPAYSHRRKNFASQELSPRRETGRGFFHLKVSNRTAARIRGARIIPFRCIDARGVRIVPPSEPCCPNHPARFTGARERAGMWLGLKAAAAAAPSGIRFAPQMIEPDADHAASFILSGSRRQPTQMRFFAMAVSKTITEIRSLARGHTRAAINVLVGVMRNKDSTPAARVSAANAILERGWGKAAQPLQSGGDGTLELIHRIERVIVHPENSHS
jgi:hypothetical protein